MKNHSYLTRLKHVSIITAMADMATLLIIFFMATTTTEPPKGIEVDVPQAITQGAEQDCLYLTISKKGDVYLEGRLITLQDLYDYLATRQIEKDRVVAITADKNLDYAEVLKVMTVLQEQDFLNIVFMSESRIKERKAYD